MSEELEASQGLPEGEPVAETAQPEAQETVAEQPEQQVEEPEKPKHKPWFQARIDELTREKHDERRAREALEARLRKLEATTPEGEAIPVTDRDESIRKEAEALVQKREFDKRCDDVYSSGAKEFTDFDEKLGQFRHLGGLPPQFLDAVTKLPDAHKVLHALGSDLDQAAHIISLPPVELGLALARLSASPAPKPVSSAPAPIRPIDGAPRGEKSPDDMTTEEWMEWREKTLNGG